MLKRWSCLQNLYPHTEQSLTKSANWLTPWNQTLWVYYVRQYSHPNIDICFFPNVTKCRISLTLILSDAGFPQGLEDCDPFHRRQWPVSVLQRQSELLRESRRGEFAAIRQLKGSGSVRQKAAAAGWGRNNNKEPSPCVMLGAQSPLMISLQQNNQALWAGLPLIVLLCRTWMRHAFPFNEHILPPQPPFLSAFSASATLHKHTGHSDRPCS